MKNSDKKNLSKLETKMNASQYKWLESLKFVNN
jgi:hypothetical protein